jgi:D-alanyl-D-alanine dipeptidase
MGRLLLAAALLCLAGCATPPAHAPAPGAADCPSSLPAMTDLSTLRPAPAVEVRYATAQNFTGAPLPGYEEARALLRPAAAAALQRVEARLRPEGLGLKVWDAYRPVRATLAMVDWAERTNREWVLDQGYVARKSGHNLGNTADLTLVDLRTGREVDMGTPFDTFGEAAHTASASGAVLENRTRLVRAMEAEGWKNYENEWWHYSLPGSEEPMDIPTGCF